MKKGFSLIEVCISVFVILAVVASLTAVFYTGFLNLRKAKARIAAYFLVQEFMEEYSDWDTLDELDAPGASCTTNGIVSNAIYNSGNKPSCKPNRFNPVTFNNITYTPQLAIFDGPTNPNELKQITVTIAWDGGTKSLTLTSLKADY